MSILMKFLFLNPKIDTEHQLIKALEKRGAVFLFPADPEEAFQMLQLHGPSIDLAIVHREGLGSGNWNSGLKFISKLKADPEHRELPVILTTDVWTEADCASHQDGPEGVNAYLKTPLEEKSLIETIETILGQQLRPEQTRMMPRPTQSEAPETSPPTTPLESLPATSDDALILEDATAVLSASTPDTSMDGGIQLESPDSGAPLEISLSTNAPSIPTVNPEIPIEIPPALPLDSAPQGTEALAVSTLDATTPTVHQPEIEIQPTIAQTMVQGAPIEGIQIGEAPPSPADVQSAEISLGQGPSQISLSTDSRNQEDPALDQEIAQELPYLFKTHDGKPISTNASERASLQYSEPIGDAVIPGGMSQSPDIETLKKYLHFREEDVAILSHQLKAAQDQIQLLEQELKNERAKSTELDYTIGQQKTKIEGFDQEKDLLIESHQAEISELKFQIKVSNDRSRLLEKQTQDMKDQMEQLKDRVRSDIRKIRTRERELENRLEILKKDSETLILSRENKIVELKRKLDLLEFNIDLLQDQYIREKENSAKLREKLGKAAQAVKLAGGLLTASHGSDDVVAHSEDKT